MRNRNNDGLIENGYCQAIRTAKERAEVLEKLKEALMAKDDDNIRKFAMTYCGFN